MCEPQTDRIGGDYNFDLDIEFIKSTLSVGRSLLERGHDDLTKEDLIGIVTFICEAEIRLENIYEFCCQAEFAPFEKRNLSPEKQAR